MLLVVLFSFLFSALIFQSQWHRVFPKKEIPEEILDRLIALGSRSLKTQDVPVGAVLVYDGKIIGEGFNGVEKNKALSAHAELKAIDEAYAKYGSRFFELDRELLVLYSSFEPCEMCKGAMVHYNIRKVYFEERKPVLNRVRGTAKSLLYEFRIRKMNHTGLQKELFEKHPSYRQHHGLDDLPDES